MGADRHLAGGWSRGHTDTFDTVFYRQKRLFVAPCARAWRGVGGTHTDSVLKKREHSPEPLSVFTGGAAAASALRNLLTSGRMNEAQTAALPLQLRHAHAQRGSPQTAPPNVRGADGPKRPLVT